MRIEMIKDTSDIYTTMIQAQLRLVADSISKAAHEGKDRVVLIMYESRMLSRHV